MGKTNDSTIKKTNDSTIKKSNDSTIKKTNDSTIKRKKEAVTVVEVYLIILCVRKKLTRGS